MNEQILSLKEYRALLKARKATTRWTSDSFGRCSVGEMSEGGIPVAQVTVLPPPPEERNGFMPNYQFKIAYYDEAPHA